MAEEAVLPPDVTQALQRLPAALDRGAAAGLVDEIIRTLAGLPADRVAAAAPEIAAAARLWPERYDFPRSWFAWRSAGELQLEQVPRLKWIFLFHRDGYLRADALTKIEEGAPSAFLAAAIAFRLNDWVPQVRAAARACAERAFPRTEPRRLADAALFLLDRGRSWRRWGHEGEAIPQALIREEVAEMLALLIGGKAQGPMPQLLVRTLRWREMEAQLPALFRSAVQPGVRALALDVIAKGRARWPVGRERKWLDKSLGRYVEVTAYAERPLALAVDIEALIRAGASDRSAAVRKMAAQALIDRGAGDQASRELLERLAADSAPAVRERARFALDARSGADASR